MPELRDKYPMTNLFVIDSELWNFAKNQASELLFKSVSEYIFELLEITKESYAIRKIIIERFSLRLKIKAEQARKRYDEHLAEREEEQQHEVKTKI